jgi:hypothetical protein
VTATSARSSTRTPPAVRPTGQWPVDERSMLSSVLGIPPLAALGLAFGFTALGVFVDLQRIGTVGTVFRALYFCGCVLAVTWVRRRNLFGPVVAPPLLLAVAVPAIVLMGDGANGTDTLLIIAAPRVNSFPTMAVTTGVVLVLGLGRLTLQREVSERRGSAAAREATRRPATPRRS